MAKRDDYEYEETPVKKVGKSKGRKGNVPPKTYVVPDLINEGEYVDTKVSNTKSGGKGGKGNQYTKTKNKTESPDGQNVKYQAPKNVGKASIDELPGQMTKPIPVPKKTRSK